jgi:hypothetical protein
MVNPNPAAKGPEGPSSIHFHVTGLDPAGTSVKFGAALSSELFGTMLELLQSYGHAMKGGIGLVNKMTAVVKQLDALDDLVSNLGTVSMKPSQIVQWVLKFKAGVAATKGAIEALGDPQWISMLTKSLDQVSSLVTQTNFLQVVQDAVKQLAYIEQVSKDLGWSGNGKLPDAATYFQAYEALDSDIGAIKTLGQHLSSVGTALNNPSLIALGKSLDGLQKNLQSLVDYIGGMSNELEGSFKMLYTEWLEDTQKGDTKGVKQILARTNQWWSLESFGSNKDYWTAIDEQAGKYKAQATDVSNTKLSPNLMVEIINGIETGNAGTWLDFPEMDTQYKTAITAIQTMDQTAGQFSRTSTTTLNTLTTGMGAVIRNFDENMMQAVHLVDFVLSNILKKR